MADDLYVAKDAANFDYDGNPVFIGKGAIIRAGHPYLKTHPELWEPLTVHFDYQEPERKTPVKDDPAVKSSRADQQEARSR